MFFQEIQWASGGLRLGLAFSPQNSDRLGWAPSGPEFRLRNSNGFGWGASDTDASDLPGFGLESPCPAL